MSEKLTLTGKDRTYTGRLDLTTFHELEERIDDIMLLEEKTNIPEIRASRRKIIFRFCKGMKMSGLWIDGKLVSSLGFRFDRFFPDKADELPETFALYSTPELAPSTDCNSVFIDGFNVDYELRDKGLGKIVAKHMLDAVIKEGKLYMCEYLVGDPRLHTYNGCNQPPIENFRQDLKLKEAVDKAMNGEREFTMKDLLRDPEFRTYYWLIGGADLIKLMPSTWFPEDKPSGGHGVYVYKEIK